MKLISHIFAISSGIAIACLALVLPGCHKTEKSENDQVKDSKEAQKKANDLESAPDKRDGSVSTEQVAVLQVDNLDRSNSDETEAHSTDNTTHLQQAQQLEKDMLAFDWGHIDPKQYEFHEEASIKYGAYPVHYNYTTGKVEITGKAETTGKAGTPEVTGSLDRRLIQKVFRNHSSEVRECYLREVGITKDISGRVVVQLTINPKGEVEKVSIVESTLNNKNVEQCITDSIRYWRFPAPKDGENVDVKVPMTFSSPEE